MFITVCFRTLSRFRAEHRVTPGTPYCMRPGHNSNRAVRCIAVRFCDHMKSLLSSYITTCGSSILAITICRLITCICALGKSHTHHSRNEKHRHTFFNILHYLYPLAIYDSIILYVLVYVNKYCCKP